MVSTYLSLPSEIIISALFCFWRQTGEEARRGGYLVDENASCGEARETTRIQQRHRPPPHLDILHLPSLENTEMSTANNMAPKNQPSDEIEQKRKNSPMRRSESESSFVSLPEDGPVKDYRDYRVRKSGLIA